LHPKNNETMITMFTIGLAQGLPLHGRNTDDIIITNLINNNYNYEKIIIPIHFDALANVGKCPDSIRRTEERLPMGDTRGRASEDADNHPDKRGQRLVCTTAKL